MSIRSILLSILASVLSMMPAVGGAVDVQVRDVPVRVVAEGLARSSGINLVLDDTVQGMLTMCLHDVTVDEALQAIADSQNLLYDKQGDIRMMTAGRKAEYNRSIHTFPLQYAAPQDMREAILAMAPESDVRCHDETNSVIVYAGQREAAAVRSLLDRLDVPARQVKLEVEVAAVNRDAMKEMGVDWDWQPLQGGPGYSHSFVYESRIHALETKGKAKILARPHIMTMNGREARILIGDKIPVLVEHIKNGETTTTTEYTDAGIKLAYTPRVHPDGTLTAAVQAEVSTPVLVPEMKAYRIVTRQAETQVRMESGKTLVIGGLIDVEDIENWRRVPLLSRLPIIGKLFQSKYTSKKETEVVLFLRAHIAE
jgi:protein transport protein HofQ